MYVLHCCQPLALVLCVEHIRRCTSHGWLADCRWRAFGYTVVGDAAFQVIHYQHSAPSRLHTTGKVAKTDANWRWYIMIMSSTIFVYRKRFFFQLMILHKCWACNNHIWWMHRLAECMCVCMTKWAECARVLGAKLGRSTAWNSGGARVHPIWCVQSTYVTTRLPTNIQQDDWNTHCLYCIVYVLAMYTMTAHKSFSVEKLNRRCSICLPLVNWSSSCVHCA